MKSPDAFRTISEVANELDVPQHVLRFWETRFSQVRPMKRGGGRRYYRPEDVALLRGIHRLLYSEGFTIKGVQKILRERGAQHVAATSQPGGAGTSPAAGGKVVQLAHHRDGGERDGGTATAMALRVTSEGPGEPTVGVRALLEETISELSALKSIIDRARE